MSNYKTPVMGPVVRYSNRNLPKDLLDRMRLIAATRRGEFLSVEHVCNEALKIGLEALETTKKRAKSA